MPFPVESPLSPLPCPPGGLVRYLASAAFPGIGPALGEALVDHFGEDAARVLENHPERLTEVAGIGPGRARKLAAGWALGDPERDLRILLLGSQFSPGLVDRLLSELPPGSRSSLLTTPYSLQGQVEGLGFSQVDALAQTLGLPTDHPARVSAAGIHILRKALEEGHVFLPGRLWEARVRHLLGVPREVIRERLPELAQQGELLQDEGDIYLPAWHQAEVECARRLARLLCHPSPLSARRPPPSPTGGTTRLTSLQLRAVERSQSARLLLLTGGPGTGKTTVLGEVVRQARSRRERVLLAAPTGRAARRLSEATSSPARTLHRLLEIDPESREAHRGPLRPLDADLVIVDEASMLDQGLFRDLIRALPVEARLLLVGDPDQLPPVGPGEVLGELLSSGSGEVVKLEQVFRQARGSAILAVADQVRRGRPLLEACGRTTWETDPASDLEVVLREEPEEILGYLARLLEGPSLRFLDLDPREDLQVLTPTRRGALGTRSLNAYLQAVLNPEGDSIEHAGRHFRVGDKVMQLRNDSQREVSNGDLGWIASIHPPEGVRVRFEVGLREYRGEGLEDLDLAYACTIHKAQGGEFPAVVLVLHPQHFPLLERRLLYTGLTRGRRKVVVLGTRKALELATCRFREVRRFTHLARRLRRAVLASAPASPYHSGS